MTRGRVSHERPRIKSFPLTCTLDRRTQWRAPVIWATSRGLLLAGNLWCRTPISLKEKVEVSKKSKNDGVENLAMEPLLSSV